MNWRQWIGLRPHEHTADSATIFLWNSLVGVIDANIIILWLLYNSLLAVGNLVPHRSRQSGHIGIATQQDLAP
jgi:hypothetical protein